MDLAALDTFIEFKRRIGTTGGFNPDPQERPATRRLPCAVGKAGPRAHGHSDRRQVLAASLAQRRTAQDGPALRLHAGRSRIGWITLYEWLRDHALSVEENKQPSRPTVKESFGPDSPTYERDIATLKALYDELRRLQHHQGQEAVVAEPAHGRPGRNSRRAPPRWTTCSSAIPT